MKVKRRQANIDLIVQISGRVLNLEITVRRYDRNNDTDTETNLQHLKKLKLKYQYNQAPGHWFNEKGSTGWMCGKYMTSLKPSVGPSPVFCVEKGSKKPELATEFTS